MEVKLPNVRIAFSQIYKAKAVNEGDEPAYSASFIFEKTSPNVKTLNVAIDAVAKEKWGDKAPLILKGLRQQDRTCLHDGDLKEYDGFPGNFFVTSRNKTRPLVIDRDKTPLTESDGKPYSGCYVNAVVDVWAQEHAKHGKRVNAALKGVQFVKDGDAFSGGAPASTDAFDDLGEGADAEALA